MKKVTLLLLCLCFVGSLKAVELSSAKITALTGVAEASKLDANKKQTWAPATLGLILNQNDEVRTRDGRVEVTFDDDSKITLKDNTSLSLNTLKDKDMKGDTLVKLWIGKIRAKFTIQKDDSTFKVQTKNIIAAVKGTDLVADADSNGGTVSVIEGIVSLTDPLSNKEIFIKAGEKASFAGAFNGQPEEMGKEEKEKLEDEWSEKPKEEPKEDKKAEDKKTGDTKVPEAPAAQSPKAPENAGGDFGASFGAVSVDGNTYYMMSFLYELTLGKFGAGFDVRLLWDDNGIKEDDWKNWQMSLQNMFKYIRYGLKGEPFYIKLGILDNSLIGHGFMVRRYSNIGVDINKRTFGLETDFKMDALGFEGLCNDVMWGRLYAGRLYYDLLPNFLQIGVTGVYDYNPAKDKFKLNNLGVAVPLAEAGPLVEYGADLGLSLVKTDLLSVLVYADYGKFKDAGEGFAAPGILGKVGIFDYQFEYRSMQSNYIAGLFDYAYEDNRPISISTLPVGSPRLKGVFGQLGANPVPWIRMVAAYQQYEGGLPYVRGEACYKGNFIPKISEVAIGYEQKDIVEVTLKSPNTVAYARVGMEMAPGVIFLFTTRQTYDPLLDVFKRSTSMAMQMRF